MRARLFTMLQRPTCPPIAMGIAAAIACILLETLLAFGLKQITPLHSLDIVYIFGIVAIASVWGLWLGLGVAVASMFAFDYFLIPPVWSLTPTKGEDWAVLSVYLAIALLASLISRLARSLATEAEARTESDLTAEVARLMLRAPDLRTALPTAGRHLARVLRLPSAAIELGSETDESRYVVFPLQGERRPKGTLVVPSDLPRPVLRRLRERVVPSLEVLLEAARDREATADALKASRDKLRRIAEEQAALRRLATLVAHGVPPAEVFDAVARELGRFMRVPHTTVIRYESDETATSVGVWNQDSQRATLPLNSRWPIEHGSVAELVSRTGAAGRVNLYEGAGQFLTLLRTIGLHSAVGCPIIVGGRLWGAVVASSTSTTPMPPDTEARMTSFTELAAAAVANAENHAELIASRARVVAAADATRRLIERDLHDGTQQRLVALKMELRAMEATVPAEMEELRGRLFHSAQSLESAVEDLREISRGLHPAILSRGGLQPALRALARRCPVPVELDLKIDRRLPERVEVSIYYIVSEALTNAAKHAQATVVGVDLVAEETAVRLTIRDDGVGGADPGRGGGLVSLKDRVETLGGRLQIVSPHDEGTSLQLEIPYGGRPDASSGP
jgi:signal transduction histidine kinase